MRWAGHVARMAEVFTGFRFGGPKGRALGRPMFRWEDNIKMNIRELVIDNELSGSIKKAGCFLTI